MVSDCQWGWYVIVLSSIAPILGISACGRNQETADTLGQAGARVAVDQQPADPQTPPLAEAPFNSQQARAHQEAWAAHLGQPVAFTNSIGMSFCLIPPGEFMMGSPESERGRSYSEGPQHRVRITRPFYLGVYEVTQAEYERVMGTNPSVFARARDEAMSGYDTGHFPVDRVSWYDAVEFCRRLSAMPEEQAAGRVYRLPTEAQWEYACRAGTTPPFYFGSVLDGHQANCNGHSPYGTTKKGSFLSRPTAVGSYSPNAFGLYDMHGNVQEWVSDWFAQDYYSQSPCQDPPGPASGSLRVLRGGNWGTAAVTCRSASRFALKPDFPVFAGFRVAIVMGCEKVMETDTYRVWTEPEFKADPEREAVLSEPNGTQSDLATVMGRVTVDGHPLEGARVVFQPSCESGTSSCGTTDANGAYHLMFRQDRSGATPGEHIVRISKLVPADGLVDETPGELIESLPARYNTRSKLNVTVAHGLNSIDFDLAGDGP
jgi:formylglycine-generating enzyme required for sulfatase activity